MRKIVGLGGILLALVSTTSRADTITVDGVTYENAVVTETNAMYYVQLPKEGRCLNVIKPKTASAKVVISTISDPVERSALIDEYKRNASKAVMPPPQPLTGAHTGSEPPRTLPAPELQEDGDPNIRQKQDYVDEKGTPKLVLKGNYQKDPAREASVLQWHTEKRQRDEKAAREQREYALEQQRIDAEREQAAMQAQVQAMRLEEERLHHESLHQQQQQQQQVVVNNINLK